MGVYTAPNMNFISTYIDGAKARDQKNAENRRMMLEGAGNLVKGGVEAYKWQQRKNILDKADDLSNREKDILAELEKLKSERDNEAKSNMSAIMAGTNWKGTPYKYGEQADDFKAPVGIGIYKKEYL